MVNLKIKFRSSLAKLTRYSNIGFSIDKIDRESTLD